MVEARGSSGGGGGGGSDHTSLTTLYYSRPISHHPPVPIFVCADYGNACRQDTGQHAQRVVDRVSASAAGQDVIAVRAGSNVDTYLPDLVGRAPVLRPLAQLHPSR